MIILKLKNDVYCTGLQVDYIFFSKRRSSAAMIVVKISTGKLKSELSWETAEELREKFSHIYGTLNTKAVIGTLDLVGVHGKGYEVGQFKEFLEEIASVIQRFNKMIIAFE